jgi:hypothetical protein
MTTSFNTSANANPVSAVQNEDGSWTYRGTLADLSVTYTMGETDYACVGQVDITVTTPTDMPQVGSGGGLMFRFAGDGGYNVHISGAEFP